MRLSSTPLQFTRTDFFAFAVLLLAALAFVWPLFVPGWIIPQGGGDLVSFLWPTYRYAARTLHEILGGRTPFSALLWNPTLYSGAPFAADNQTGLFYPPNLALFLLFPDFPYAALEALVAFHLFIAGVGMYLFMRFECARSEMREWTPELRREIGLFSALAFMASDVFITHLGNYNIVAVSAYLPFTFLCLRQSLGSSLSRDPAGTGQSPMTRLRWTILSGVAFGLAALAGHAQMTFILAMACLLYGVYELVVQGHWRVVALGAVSGLVAFGLAAIALLPALEMLRYTARAALDYAEASRWSLPPLGLAGTINPLVFGRGARDFWPSWDRVEFGYMGVAALALLPLARSKASRFYWILALAGLLIAFGKYTPIHYFLYQYIPGFASLRVPARFILLTNFAFAVLAGYGLAARSASAERDPFRLDPIAEGAKVRRGWPLAQLRRLGLRVSRWELGFGILLAGLVLFAPLALGRQPAWGPALLTLALFVASSALFRANPSLLSLLLFIELFAFGAFVEVDRADPNAGYPRGPAARYLLEQPGPTRIDIATSQWQPDAPAVLGLESVTGISNPLALAAYHNYYWSVGYRGSPQYNFLSVQYVVADKDIPPADSTFIPVFNEDPQVDIYLNSNALPRISLIDDPVFVDSDAAAFAAIHAPTFSPASQVVLQSSAAGQAPRLSRDPARTGQSSAAAASLSSNLYYAAYAPGRFVVVAQTPSPVYLVLAEVWYPGWAATLNGSPASILRANTAFMAVPLPAGENTVEFQFTSPMLGLGALITALTLLACIWVLARGGLRLP